MKQKIDSVGRILIPNKIRKEFNLNLGDYVELLIENNAIILVNTKPKQCVVCSYETDNETEVCNECKQLINQIRGGNKQCQNY